MTKRRHASVLLRLLALVVLLGGCTSAGPASGAPTPPQQLHVSGRSGGSASPPDRAEQLLQKMTPAQRVGQLFMVGTPATGLSQDALTAVRRYHVGSVILTGRSHLSVAATRSITERIQQQATAAHTAGVGFLVATDQEGGNVQVLQGQGFSPIPDALTQGSWDRRTLRQRAHAWGKQLHRAGVNLNLAPVADTVPARLGRGNGPIGYWLREYGHSPAAVAHAATAFQRGMLSAGVQVTVKHFPGLGRVRENTDTHSGVTDDTTTRHDPYLRPFRAGIDAGARFVLMATAHYSRLDTGPAAFSSTVIRGMLRHDLGFDGVVISDDLGRAQQVQRWTPAQRAVRFLSAGGDLVLTVEPAQAAAMTKAVLRHYRSNTAFRHSVNTSVLRVLRAKEAMHLLPPQ